jgi:integrase
MTPVITASHGARHPRAAWLEAVTPHDLRRTAATLAGDLGFDDAWIAKCLDHAASKKQEQTVPTVTDGL